jgi:hypothetical protein
MPWSRRFDDPIKPPKGKPLVTLSDAAQLQATMLQPSCQALTESDAAKADEAALASRAAICWMKL